MRTTVAQRYTGCNTTYQSKTRALRQMPQALPAVQAESVTTLCTGSQRRTADSTFVSGGVTAKVTFAPDSLPAGAALRCEAHEHLREHRLVLRSCIGVHPSAGDRHRAASGAVA